MKRFVAAALAACLVAPAYSKEVARYEGPQGVVALSDDRRDGCEDGWLKAEWRPAEGAAVAGCWFAHKTDDGRTFILVAYEDGDRIAYRGEFFKGTP